MVRERIAILSDAPVRGFHIGGLEGRLAYDQRVNYHSQRPDVDLVGVAGLAFEDFRRNIVRSTANCSLFLSVEVEFGREAEITQLDLHLVVEEEVAQLEITMDNAMRVQILQSANDLRSVALDFQLVKALTAFKQFVHALILAQLE